MNAKQRHALKKVLDYLAEDEKEDYESLLEESLNGKEEIGGGQKISDIMENHVWPSMVILYDFLDGVDI